MIFMRVCDRCGSPSKESLCSACVSLAQTTDYCDGWGCLFVRRK